jgi:dUTP pyrophosphatase
MVRDSIPHKMIAVRTDLTLNVKKLHLNAMLPTKAHTGDLGFDLYALEDTVLEPGKVTKVRTGIAIGFPEGYGGLIRDRSSVATKANILVAAGVIDQQYTGEIIVAFFNPGYPDVEVKPRNFWSNWFSDTPNYSEVNVVLRGLVLKAGDKIAQLILTPVITFPVKEVEELGRTDRGSNGFGSSGQ